MGRTMSIFHLRTNLSANIYSLDCVGQQCVNLPSSHAGDPPWIGVLSRLITVSKSNYFGSSLRRADLWKSFGNLLQSGNSLIFISSLLAQFVAQAWRAIRAPNVTQMWTQCDPNMTQMWTRWKPNAFKWGSIQGYTVWGAGREVRGCCEPGGLQVYIC